MKSIIYYALVLLVGFIAGRGFYAIEMQDNNTLIGCNLAMWLLFTISLLLLKLTEIENSPKQRIIKAYKKWHKENKNE